MASYNIPIRIEKLNLDTEDYETYYSTHANINKVGGKEYENASTNISNSTFNFKVRFCELVKAMIYDTELYRIAYDNRYYDVKNVDRYGESTNELTIIGDYNGKTYTN